MSPEPSTADPLRYYDEFSLHYDSRRHGGYHAVIDELEAGFVAEAGGATCLEAGCGTGLILSRLAPVFRSRTGVDLSSGMLSRARSRGHTVAQASITALPFPTDSFDTVYSFKVLAHVPDITLAVQELVRVTKPGGRVVLEFYNRRSLRGLRWLLKMLVGGERTGKGTAETALFTRYDDQRSIMSYLPSNAELVGVRGCIIFTPAAVFLNLPVVGGLLASVERWAARTRLARYAGFMSVVIEKRGATAMASGRSPS